MGSSEFERWAGENLRGANTVELHTAQAAWLAALAAAEAKLPSASIKPEYGETRGWNRCLSEVSERLASLKAGAQ
jgi:hypothetical protein